MSIQGIRSSDWIGNSESSK